MKDVKLWRYYLPSAKGEGWAIFVLGSDGYFSAVSDYGNYAYLWSAHGCDDFREFLLRADRDWDYFVNKLFMGRKKEYDGEATLKGIKEYLWERMGDGSIDKTEYDEQEALLSDCNDLECEEDFRAWLDKVDWDKISDPYEYRCECYPPDVLAFVQKAMVRLIPLLNADLEKEKV